MLPFCSLSKTVATLLSIVGLVCSLNAMAITVKDCKVFFKTKGKPVLVTIEGKSESPCDGKIEGSSEPTGTFKLNLNKLDTGIPLRNKHLRENYLHTDKYPESVLRISKIEDYKELSTKKDGSKSAAFAGTIELHGATKPITDGQYKITGNTIAAEFSVLLPDFGIDQPSFMGIKVVDRVYINAEISVDGY